MGFDIAGLMQEATKQAGLISRSQDTLQDLNSQNSIASDALVNATRGGTDARGNTQLSVETELLGRMQAQQAQQELRKYIGDSGEGAAKISNRLAESYQKTIQAALEQANVVAEKESVGLFDNPIQFLWNQITLPDEKNKLTGLKTAADVASTGMQNLNAMMSQRAKVESEYAVTLSKASIDSQAEGVKNNIEADAQRARIQAIASNAHMVQNVMAAGQTQLENLNRVIVARNSAEHLALARDTHAMERKKFGAWQKENADKQEFAAQMTDYYNAGAEAAGLEPLTTDKLQNLFKMGGTMAKNAQLLAEQGYANRSTGLNVLGPDPARAAELVSDLRLQLPKDKEFVGQFYQAGMAAVQKATVAGTLKKGDAEQARKIFNEGVRAAATLAQDSSKYDVNSPNPYNVATPAVLANSPNVARTALFQKVLAPQIPQGLDNSEPNRILELGLAAVRDGKITAGELADGVVRYYSTGMQANNQIKQFNKYGLPEQTSITTKLNSNKLDLTQGGARVLNPIKGTTQLLQYAAFGTAPKETVTLTDLTSVNNFIVRQLTPSLSLDSSALLGTGDSALQPILKQTR